VGDKRFPTYAEVEVAMTERIGALAAEEVKVDSITFSGNGEPTMNPDFAEIIDLTLRLRDTYYPEAKVSVLSNATLIGREHVFNALKKIDNPIMKIDAFSDALVQKMNKPVGAYHIKEVISNLERFEGNFILQTMFLRSEDFDTLTPEALNGWMNIVRQLRPREIMVYTIDRQTPEKSLKKYTIEEMTDFVQPLLDEGFKIQIKG
jgi:wyosine [tRNA(Phe)-imidazoG37] synthetase (radical SAM superfamily)